MPGRLPLVTRLLYASGSIGGNAIGRSKDLWLLYFYAPPDDADISRRTTTLAVGVVLFSIRFIEAFDDPLIGYWSDRTRSRWGRRIPFVVAATPFLSLMFVVLWFPPSHDQSMSNAIFLFGALALFHLFSTLSGGPFESLLPEIARNNEDRLSIVSWQVAFGVAGAAVALVGSGFIIDAFGFQVMAMIMATLALVFRFVALAGAWRPAVEAARTASKPPPAESFWQSIATCMRNDQFVLFLPTYIFYNMGVLMITGVMPFLVKAVLEFENEGTMTALINAVAIGMLVAVLPLFVRMAKRHGKRRMYSLGMLYAAVYFPFLFFIGFIPGIPPVVQILIYAAFLGLPLAPLQTFPNALIADLTDYDTLRTGERREGTYYATQAMFEKTASSLAPLLLAILLTLGSTTENPIGIRLVGPVAGLSTLIGYLAFRGFWLPDSVNEESVRAVRPQALERRP
ncbi:MAG: MFS transporter [Chloroflexi bacterium]|nr:MFS transporter [Chloroflexota bacterium]